MHGRRDKERPEDGFKPFWNLQTAVVELGTKDDTAFKDQYTQKTRTQEKNEGYLGCFL